MIHAFGMHKRKDFYSYVYFCFDLYYYAYIFYLIGEPILRHLLRYRVFAVKDHSFIPCALHLTQSRLVNNPI